MKLVRKDDHSVEIVSTLETILGTCGICNPHLDDGKLKFEYDGTGTDVWWDTQQTDTVHGTELRIFVDKNGEHVPEDKTELIEE